MRGKLFSFSRYFIPILLVSPTLFWVALDRYPFGGDQSHYGSNAIELFYFLAHEPSEWCSAMMKALLFKAPGLVWLGQFFVPLSHIFGSIDKSLLWSILITQAIVLVLTYKSLQELTSGDSSVAILGCLIIAAAPLFIHFSHEFMVEPLQTLGTSYFILLMTFAPKWNRGLLLSHLLLATATAMLAKATSPF